MFDLFSIFMKIQHLHRHYLKEVWYWNQVYFILYLQMLSSHFNMSLQVGERNIEIMMPSISILELQNKILLTWNKAIFTKRFKNSELLKWDRRICISFLQFISNVQFSVAEYFFYCQDFSIRIVCQILL